MSGEADPMFLQPGEWHQGQPARFSLDTPCGLQPFLGG